MSLKKSLETIGDKEIFSYLSRMTFFSTSYGLKIPCVPKILRIDNMEFNLDVANKIMERF